MLINVVCALSERPVGCVITTLFIALLYGNIIPRPLLFSRISNVPGCLDAVTSGFRSFKNRYDWVSANYVTP